MTPQPTPAALRAAEKLCQCGLLFEGDAGLAAGVLDAELAQVDALRERARELEAALVKALAYIEGHRPRGKIREIFAELNQVENDIIKPARAILAMPETLRADREGSK